MARKKSGPSAAQILHDPKYNTNDGGKSENAPGTVHPNVNNRKSLRCFSPAIY
jgi:hypothetical protein